MAIKVVVKPNPTIIAKPKTENAISTSGTVFIGSSNAFAEANLALSEANTALALANTKLAIAGGEITGNLTVDGTFIAIVDGGNNGF